MQLLIMQYIIKQVPTKMSINVLISTNHAIIAILNRSFDWSLHNFHLSQILKKQKRHTDVWFAISSLKLGVCVLVENTAFPLF